MRAFTSLSQGRYMDRFPRVIGQLKDWQAQLVEQLRESGGATELVKQKAQVDDALRCLDFCARHKLDVTARVIELPDQAAGYFKYRIMADNEVDDRKWWTELLDDQGKPIRAVVGDVIILNSE